MMQIQKEWSGKIIERESVENLLEELTLDLSMEASPADMLRTGKMLAATYYIQIKVKDDTVQLTSVKCRNGTVLHEKELPKSVPLPELARLAAKDFLTTQGHYSQPESQLRISIGAFIDMTTFKEYSHIDTAAHEQLRKKLLQNDRFLVNERLTPSPLLSELDLNRQGHFENNVPSASIYNMAADILVMGILRTPQSIDFKQNHDEIEFEIILASPSIELPARHVSFFDACRNVDDIVLRIQKELLDYADVIESAKASMGQSRGHSRQRTNPYGEEARFFREAGLRIMAQSSSFLMGDRERMAHNRTRWQSIRALENAMLLDSDDALLRTKTGVNLISIARAKFYEIDLKITHRGYDRNDPELVAKSNYYEKVLEVGVDYLLLGYAMDPNQKSREHILDEIQFLKGSSYMVYAREADASSLQAARMLEFVINSGVENGWGKDYVNVRAAADLIFANRDLDSALEFMETLLQEKHDSKFIKSVLDRLGVFQYCNRNRMPPEHFQKIKKTAERLISNDWSYASFLGHNMLRVMLYKQDNPDCIRHTEAMIELKKIHHGNNQREWHFDRCLTLGQLESFLASYQKEFFNEPINRIKLSKEWVARAETPEDYRDLDKNHILRLLEYYHDSEQYQKGIELATKYFGSARPGSRDSALYLYLKNWIKLNNHMEPSGFDVLPSIRLPEEVETNVIREMHKQFGRIWLIVGAPPSNPNTKGNALWINTGTNAEEAKRVPGIESDLVRGLSASEESLCFGGYDGFFAVNPESNTVEQFTKDNSGLPNNRIRNIRFLRGDFILTVDNPSSGYDLYYSLTPDFQSLTKIPSRPRERRGSISGRRHILHKNNLKHSLSVIYSHRHYQSPTVYRFTVFTVKNKEKDQVLLDHITPIPFPSYFCGSVALWQDRLWLGCSHALAYYNLKTGVLRIAYMEKDNRVRNLMSDGDRLLVGTYNGLYYIDSDAMEHLAENPIFDVIPPETVDHQRFGNEFVEWRRAWRYMVEGEYRKAAVGFRWVKYEHRDTVFHSAAALNQVLCEIKFEDKAYHFRYHNPRRYLSTAAEGRTFGPYRGQAYLHIGERLLTHDFELSKAQSWLIRAKEWKDELPQLNRITDKNYHIPEKAESVTTPPSAPKFLDFELIPSVIEPYMIVNDRTTDWYMDRLTARALYWLGFVKAVENDWQSAREFWGQAFEINDRMDKFDVEHFDNLNSRLIKAAEDKSFIASPSELKKFNGDQKTRLKIMLAGFYTVTQRHLKADELYNELGNIDSFNTEQKSILLEIIAKAHSYRSSRESLHINEMILRLNSNTAPGMAQIRQLDEERDESTLNSVPKMGTVKEHSGAWQGELKYSETEGEITIIACAGLAGNVTIPATIDGKPITAIGDSAFRDCSGLTNVTIPDSVTRLGDHAFADCTTLTSVTIGESVTSIGFSAFRGCNSLANITIPDSVTRIGDHAFADCADLRSVTIGESVTSIGDFAFMNCTSLTSVMFPDSVTSIGKRIFLYCDNLREILVDKNNPEYSSSNGVLFNKDASLLIQYPGAKSDHYTIPGSVTTIKDYAFQGCNRLTSVTIPGRVKSIGRFAFSGCTSMTSVKLSSGIKNIRDFAFWGCTDLASVTIPDSAQSIGKRAFMGCASLTSANIGNGVTRLGDSAFYDCASLTNVKIPESVTRIGDHAFSNCSSLISITIPDSVTHIGSSAFRNCTSLTSVTIPGGVRFIGSRTFYCCNSLRTVYFLGNAPGHDRAGVFGNAENVLVYYLPGTKGWKDEYAGRPTRQRK
ncbi:MAG: leucine-rich repeat protein [Lentisphaeria bacterium]